MLDIFVLPSSSWACNIIRRASFCEIESIMARSSYQKFSLKEKEMARSIKRQIANLF